jgi:peroxiredoxin
MNRRRTVIGRLCVIGIATIMAAMGAATTDEVRNVKQGEAVPAYKLTAIDGSLIDSVAAKGSVVVLVYLSAEQRASELAMADSAAVVEQLKGKEVKLLHVSPDAAAKPYFERFRAEHHIDVPLAFDPERTIFHQLGLIVEPTTIVADKQGKLAHVISLRGPEYARTLDAFIRHALGLLSDDQLRDAIKSPSQATTAGASESAAHRMTASRLRENGRLDAAREELLLAKRQTPVDTEVLLDLADLDLAMGSFDEADTCIDTVLKAQPEHRRARQLHGIALYRHGRLDEAEKVLLDSLALNPDPTRVEYYLGRISEDKGDAAKAAEHYRKALRKLLNEPEPDPQTKR